MSLAVSSLTREIMKSEQPAQAAWHGYQNPLPMPSRLMSSYDFTPSVSLASSYNELPENGFRVFPATQSHVFQAREEPATAPHSPLKSRHSYPSLKRSYATFKETQNGESLSETYSAIPDMDEQSKPAIRPDNRLLCFGHTRDRRTILDQYGRPNSTEIHAQIHGMFFLSEMGMQSGEVVTLQPELTCYRRNLFQISGSVTLPAGPLSILNDRGQTVKLNAMEVSISATESVDGSAIRLIVIPWKTPPPNSPDLPRNQEQEPAPISIFNTVESGQAGNGEATARPIAWRRLQFRVATANNGRRKELQQHFVLRLSVTATLEDGTKEAVAHAVTAPIVVRGRSPRNFQARKEIPLLGSSASPRGQSSQDSPSQRKAASLPARVREQKLHSTDLPKQPFAFDASNFSLPQQRVRSG
jgi:NDT80 / PhoG like DNA-binding  family